MAVKNRANRLERIKYPKIILFVLIVLIAFIFYREAIVYEPLHNLLIKLSYLGAFIAGLFFTYGLTTPLAIAVFLVLGQENNILLTAIIGGFGAFLSDYLIFKFLRKYFSKEIIKLEHEKIVRYFEKNLPRTVKKYLVPIIAGFIIASPLPDELGVALLATSMHVTTRTLFVFSLIFNTIGILIILEIGKLI